MIDKYCNGCKYIDDLTHDTQFCAYILYEHKMRGCPAGKGCNKRKESNVEWVSIKHQIDLREYIYG